MSKMVDAMSGKKKPRYKIIDNKCHKKAYHRSGYRVVVYKANNEKTQSFMRPIRSNIKDYRKCLSTNLKFIRKQNFVFANHIIHKSKKIYDWRWNDLDLGPMQWLSDCKPNISKSTSSAIGTPVSYTHLTLPTKA